MSEENTEIPKHTMEQAKSMARSSANIIKGHQDKYKEIKDKIDEPRFHSVYEGFSDDIKALESIYGDGPLLEFYEDSTPDELWEEAVRILGISGFLADEMDRYVKDWKALNQ